MKKKAVYSYLPQDSDLPFSLNFQFNKESVHVLFIFFLDPVFLSLCRAGLLTYDDNWRISA